MTFADFRMGEARKRIVAEHPRMAEAPFLAALGNRMISECWLELTPKSKRLNACAARGIFDTDAERLIADIENAEEAFNDNRI